MAFMIPEYHDASTDGSVVAYNGELYMDAPDDLPESDSVEVFDAGFFARLSAPGYLDCTDWEGPFATEGEARAYIRDTWDVDDETGEPIEDAEPYDDFTGSPDGTPKGQ